MVVTNDGYIDEDNADIPIERIASANSFSICDGGLVAYKGSTEFWGCVKPEGGSLLLWLDNQGDCSPYQVVAIPCEA